VQVEIPEQQLNSVEDVKNLPIARRSGGQIDLRNVAGVTDGTALGEYDRYNMQRMLTLSANIAGEDLGRVAARVQQAISDTGKPPGGVNVTVAWASASRWRKCLEACVWGSWWRWVSSFSCWPRISNPSGFPGGGVDDSRRHHRGRTDALAHADHAQHSILHGRDHGDRRGRGKRHPARDFR